MDQTDNNQEQLNTTPAAEIVTYRMVGDMGPLFAAKAKARLDFKPIVKNREVEVQPKKRDDGTWPAKYKFTYATLDSVRDSCDASLAANGLDIFHLPCTGLDARELHTFLTHSSGAFIEAVLLIPDVKGWQEFGSAITYAQRYSYQALAGVASEHDDDGNAADGNQVQNSQPRGKPAPAPPPAKPGRQDKPQNGSAAQASSRPTPPSERPPAASEPAKAPEPQPAPETPPQARPAAAPAPSGAVGKLTQQQTADITRLTKDPDRPWNKDQTRELCLTIIGRPPAEMFEAEVNVVIEALELGAKAGMSAEQTLGIVRSLSTQAEPKTDVVIKELRALAAEQEAFGS